MRTTLEDLWAENPAGPVWFNRQWVHRSEVFRVETASLITIKIVRFRRQPLQGLSLTAKSCSLSCKGIVGKDLVLWAEDYKQPVNVLIERPRAGAEVHLYNSWNAFGGVDSWVRNSGMIFEDLPPGGTFTRRAYCSDGHGPADFASIVFDYRIEPVHSERRDT